MNQLSHLPQHKQDELAEIVEIISEITNPAKVILFGSHATGKWVEDEYVDKGTTYTYISDYDILVVLCDKEKGEEVEIASKIDNRTGKFKNEVSAIVHSISYINSGLERGQYFFSDIVQEGITLYDSGEYSFVESTPLTNEQLKELAIEDFNKWVKSGSRFLEATKLLYDDFSKRNLPLNEVIFNLNQSAERFYSGVLLVYTGYKPKTHRIKAYRKYAKHVSEDLYRVFRYPCTDSEENRLFKILNDAYIDARYKDDYFIAPNDLKKLISKVDKLEEIVIRLCEQRIVQL